jgi:hypothetical protein
VAAAWQAYYPPDRLDPRRAEIVRLLLATMPTFVQLLVQHRPRSLRGKSLPEVLGIERRQPAALSAAFRRWQRWPHLMRAASPSLVFAVIGQARADGRISPEREAAVLADLLSHWALVSTFSATAPPSAGAAAAMQSSPAGAAGTSPRAAVSQGAAAAVA